jgi:ATP-dependent Clp protease ATP-binding subunit ClpA
MLTAGEVDYLLDATRSTVKRFGGNGPTLSHLAYVLSDKWPDEFVKAFGEDGADDVKRLLHEKSFVGDEADVRSVLADHDNPASTLTELHARLSSLIEAAHSASDAAAGTDAAQPTESPAPSTQPAAPTEGSDAWPERTRRFLVAVEPRDDLLERDDAIAVVVAVLCRSRRRIPIIVGPRGSGRTTMLSGVAAKLAARTATDSFRVWRIAPETMGPDPAGPLARIIEDCEAPTVLMIDDVDQLAALGTTQPNAGVLMLLRAAAVHPHLRAVLVCDSRRYQRLEMHVEDLVEELAPIRLERLSDDAVHQVIEGALPAIESKHGVTISAPLRSLACLPARSTDAAVHPGLAIDRIDAAASHASVLGHSEATVADLAGVASPSARAMRARDLEIELSQRVRGQPHAVRSVASRLALTLAGLDLRPERPDGVFLFVGPTGVGKTELARAMSATLYGVEDRLIRLDMSEYSHDWAVSRLVGPMPGYVGSTEPESWLTTRVAQMPECVVLLDEIEKAHPVVWNTFLQVFDAGRLTDSRGTTVDFCSVVIVMTSNIGASQATAPPLGFATAGTDLKFARDRTVRAVKETMAPELVNRIDELVVFDPLGLEAIEQIAERELARSCHRLAESGWSVRYDHDVVSYLVSTGYDPAYGARHLQRNIERLFLGLIAESETKRLSVRVADGELVLDHD